MRLVSLISLLTIARLASAQSPEFGLGRTPAAEEIRAWDIPVGWTALQAAGRIHGDLEKSFIRAEVYTVDDLAKHKTEKAIKEAGRLRSEGKEYVMKDGDVVHFQAGLAGKK